MSRGLLAEQILRQLSELRGDAQYDPEGRYWRPTTQAPVERGVYDRRTYTTDHNGYTVPAGRHVLVVVNPFWGWVCDGRQGYDLAVAIDAEMTAEP